MKTFVFATGVIDILAGIGFQFESFSARLMPAEQPRMLIHLFGLIAVFLGIMLIFSSRDLKHRGNLVIWEGMLRLGGFALMTGYGFFGGDGLLTALSGIFDLIIGIIYLVGLPLHLKVSLTDLLLDRTPDPGQ